MYRLGLADRKSGHLTPLLQDIAKSPAGEPSRLHTQTTSLVPSVDVLGSPARLETPRD
jgi:hypothetical protein